MAFQYVLPEAVTSQLDALRRRVRQVALLYGAGLFLTISCGLLVAVMLVDWLIDLEAGSRVAGLITFCLVEMALLAWLVIRPAIQRLRDVELAVLAEEHFPELGERVSSLVEFSDPETPESEKGSPLMRELLEEETVQALTDCDFDEAVSTKPGIRRLGMGLGTLAFLVLTLLVFPSVSKLLLARLFRPWGNYGSVSQLVFEIDDSKKVVARGSDIKVTARIAWRNGAEDPVPEPVEMTWQSDDGDSDTRVLKFDPDLNAFTTTIPDAQDSFDFFVAALGSRSKEFRIEVRDRPEVLSARLEVTPPGYLGRPRETIDGVTGELTVFELSRLKFDLTFSLPVELAAIEWIAPMVLPESSLARPDDGDDSSTEATSRDDALPGKEIAAALLGKPGPAPESRNAGPYTNSLVNVEDVPDTKLQLSDDGLSATLHVLAEIQGAFAFRVHSADGLENEEGPHRQFVIIRDQPPVLDIPGGKEDRARPSDAYGVPVSVTDDVSVEKLELFVTSREGLNRVLTLPVDEAGVDAIDHEFRFDLADMAIKSGDFLKLQVRAVDGRPDPFPNEVWSEVRYLAISDDAAAPGSAEILAKQHELREELQSIRDAVREVVEESDDLHELAKAAQEDGEPFIQRDKLSPLADEESGLAQRLAELAGEFDEHAVFQKLGEQLWDLAAEELDPAANRLSEAVDGEVAEQADTLKENSMIADMVEEQLAAIEAEFEQLAELEEDLTELNRIAQRASQLADDAAEFEERREQLLKEQPLAGETDEQLAKAQDALTEDAEQLMNEQGELMESLDTLMKERPELLDAARDHQLEQLAKLAEQARDIAEPQELLAETLDRLEEDLQRLEKKDANEGGAEKPQSESPPQTPQEIADAARELAQRQEELREETARLDDEFIPDSDDPKQAKQLQQIAEQQEQLRADAQNIPVASADTSSEQVMEALEEALAALEQSDLNQAAAAQQQAQAALEEFAQATEAGAPESVSGPPAESGDSPPEQSDANSATQPGENSASPSSDSVPAPGDEPQPAGLPPDSSPQEIQQALEELAQQLAARQSAATDEGPAGATEPATGQPATSETSQAATSQPARNESAGPSETATGSAPISPAESQAVAEQAQEQLANLAEEISQALELAAEQLGAEPLGLQEQGQQAAAAQQDAEQGQLAAKQATDSLKSGDPASAAQSAKSAAKSLQQAAEKAGASAAPSSKESPIPGEFAAQIAEAARQLQEAQQQLAEAMAEAANNENSPAQPASTEGQPGSEPGATAGESGSERSARESESGQPDQAQSGDSSSSPKQPGEGQAGSDSETGSSSTGQPSDSESGAREGGPANAGEAAGDSRVPGSSSSSDNPTGSQPSGQASGKTGPSLARATQSLQQAAQKLSSAARQLASAGSQKGKGDQDSSQPGQPGSMSGDGTGSFAAGASEDELDVQLGRKGMRDWGRLSGHLNTEILQSSSRKANGDYSKLIKLYFEELARQSTAAAP